MAFDSERFERRRAQLSRLTVAELRRVARSERVTLAGAPTKDDMARAIAYERERRAAKGD